MATQADAQELAALRALSAWIGLNPHMTQAAGGNTSLKAGDTLWTGGLRHLAERCAQ